MFRKFKSSCVKEIKNADGSITYMAYYCSHGKSRSLGRFEDKNLALQAVDKYYYDKNPENYFTATFPELLEKPATLKCGFCEAYKDITDLKSILKRTKVQIICTDCIETNPLVDYSIGESYTCGSKEINFSSRIKKLHYNLISTAQKRNLSVSVTIKDLINRLKFQDYKCSLTGLDLVAIPKKLNTLSIDRIDSNEGYTASNIQFVCSAVNIMKHTLQLEDFLFLCNRITENNEGDSTQVDLNKDWSFSKNNSKKKLQ